MALSQQKEQNPAPNEYLQKLVTEEEKAAFVEREYRRYDGYLKPLHRQWYEQMLWFAGEHYLDYNAVAGRFLPVTTAPYIPRPITNYIAEKVEIGVQIWKSALPEPHAKPGTQDDVDKASAEAAGHVRRQLWRDNLMEQKLREVGLFTAIVGNGFAVPFLDSADKSTMRVQAYDMQEVQETDPSTGLPIMEPGPDGQPVVRTAQRQVPRTNAETGELEYEDYPLSDVNTLVVSPWEVVPDFSARHPWEYRRWLHHRAFSLDFIAAQYGSEATRELKPEKGLGMQHHYQFKILELVARAQGSTFSGYSTSVGSGAPHSIESLFMENSAIVKTFFELPCPLYPRGRIYSVCQDKLLYEGEYTPLYGTRLNLFHWRWKQIPGSILGVGMVKDLIDPQRRLNALDAQRMVLRKTMGNPKWMSPKGAGFRERLGTSRPGYVYTYKRVTMQGGKPEIVPPVSPPADWEIERQNLLRDMDRISGIPVILTGQNPTGVTAGVSLDLLQESAVKRFQPLIDESRGTLLRLERARLKIAQVAPAWQIGRLVQVLGEDGEAQAKEFRSADFSGQWDVELEPAPPTLFSSAQKRSDIIELLKVGMIDPNLPQNRDEVRRLFNAAEFGEAQSPDIKRARYENGVILAGGDVRIHPLDDHAVHVEEHRKPFKRMDREKLDPAALNKLAEHMRQHVLGMGPADVQPGAQQGVPPAPVPGSEGSQGPQPAEGGGGQPLTTA